jgi:hypothetical protein
LVVATTVKRRKSKSAQGRAAEHKRFERNVAFHREQMIVNATPLEDLPDVDPAEAMQMIINRTERLLRYAAAQVDALRPGVAPNQSRDNMDHELWVTWDDNSNLVVTNSYWIHREEQLTILLGKLTEAAQKLGLSDRRARVAEAQVLLLGEALQAACVAAGLNEGQRRQVGQELRTQLVLLESGQQVEVLDAA